jgi:hypothetical protein
MQLLSPRGDKAASEGLEREEPSQPTRCTRFVTVEIDAIRGYLEDYLKRPNKICQGRHLHRRRRRQAGVAEQTYTDTVFVIIWIPTDENVITVKLSSPTTRGPDRLLAGHTGCAYEKMTSLVSAG